MRCSIARTIGIRAVVHDDHDVTLSWIRRSRLGWRWIDGGDAPLGEAVERYQLRIQPSTGEVQIVERDAATFMLSAAMRASGPVVVEIRQAGDHGLSPPATVIIPAIEE